MQRPGKNSIHAETTRTLQHPCRDHFGMFLKTAFFTAISLQFTAICRNFFRGGGGRKPPPLSNFSRPVSPSGAVRAFSEQHCVPRPRAPALQVRRLPLFELQSAPGQFTAMAEGTRYHTLPDFTIAGHEGALDCPGVCLLQEERPSWASLYRQLGIAPLPREVFHATYTFSAFGSLPEALRLQLLLDLRANFGLLQDREVDGTPFRELLREAPLFWSDAPGLASGGGGGGAGSAVLMPVTELLHPDDELVSALAPLLDHRVPTAALRSSDWVGVLPLWGMRGHVPVSVLLEAAQEVAQRQAPAGADRLLVYIAQHHGALQKQVRWPQALPTVRCGMEGGEGGCVASCQPRPPPHGFLWVRGTNTHES